MNRESVLSVLLELHGEAVRNDESDERLAEIRDRICNEVGFLQADAVRGYEESMEATKKAQERFS